MPISEKAPLVSVYITNYNYGKYIKQSIKSVLKQTYQNFELIIIDDGSTDNSREIIEIYEQHPKVKIIYQKNKGLNVTNNVALRVSQGRYIMRLDADDYLDENALLVMTSKLEKDPEIGLVFPDYYLIDAENNILNVVKRHSFEKEVSLFDQPAHGACTMIRKNFLKRLGGYDEQYKCQDGYELWVKFISRYKPANVNTPLFYYRQHGANLTSNEDEILGTRKKIKENFLKVIGNKNFETLAIIPVRGSKYNVKNIPFLKINGEYILDIKIKQAIKARRIKKIIISSPDNDVKVHVKQKYRTNKKIIFHDRPEELARYNTGLNETVKNILSSDLIDYSKYDGLVILSVEYPFIEAKDIDDAVNTINIFNADSLISVREENSMFFRHDGTGMKPILNQEKFSKLERESLYRYSGGIIITTFINFSETRELISGKVGHIVITQKAAHGIKTKFDIDIAQFLYKKSLPD